MSASSAAEERHLYRSSVLPNMFLQTCFAIKLHYAVLLTYTHNKLLCVVHRNILVLIMQRVLLRYEIKWAETNDSLA